MWKVYVHTNKVNGMKYVGRTCLTMERRCLNGEGYKPKEGSSPFYDAIKSLGWKNFSTEVLYQNLTEEESMKLEKALIRKLESHISTGKGYNTMWGGESKVDFHSAETRQRLSELNKGRKRTEESRKKMSEAKKGKKRTYEDKLKIGISMYKAKNPNCSDEEAIEIAKYNLEVKAQRKANKEARARKLASAEHPVVEISSNESEWTTKEAEKLFSQTYSSKES